MYENLTIFKDACNKAFKAADISGNGLYTNDLFSVRAARQFVDTPGRSDVKCPLFRINLEFFIPQQLKNADRNDFPHKVAFEMEFVLDEAERRPLHANGFYGLASTSWDPEVLLGIRRICNEVKTTFLKSFKKYYDEARTGKENP